MSRSPPRRSRRRPWVRGSPSAGTGRRRLRRPVRAAPVRELARARRGGAGGPGPVGRPGRSSVPPVVATSPRARRSFRPRVASMAAGVADEPDEHEWRAGAGLRPDHRRPAGRRRRAGHPHGGAPGAPRVRERRDGDREDRLPPRPGAPDARPRPGRPLLHDQARPRAASGARLGRGPARPPQPVLALRRHAGGAPLQPHRHRQPAPPGPPGAGPPAAGPAGVGGRLPPGRRPAVPPRRRAGDDGHGPGARPGRRPPARHASRPRAPDPPPDPPGGRGRSSG